ncbi:hypothetical protein [Bradyrhizobium sp.]|uniref:hypothetical protein n=1 Tax=Bradyrhizobium sp. TaxID=376 RepID=UPI001D69D4B6|nr:hypothetical protein [Bradyrhizobium sp.]MBI5319669.1 hypothetical protein [Bradyrhizobium sp.]
MAKRTSIFHADKPGTAELGAPLAAMWRRLAAMLGRRYRPEQHYMRGPGPKWQESHSAGAAQTKIKDPA